MKFCPVCGMEAESSETVCSDCKTNLTEDNSTHCRHCKNHLTDSNFFCASCGRFPSEGKQEQFMAQTKNADVSGSCILCGTWVTDITAFSGSQPVICDNPDHKETFKNWATLVKVNTLMDATYTQSLLDIQNIPVRIIDQQDRSYVTTQGGLSVIRIMVPEQFFSLAKSILASNEPI